MTQQDRSPQQTSIDTASIASQLVNVERVHINVSQEVIITTEDKVRLCLSEHLKRMEKKRGWIAPLGILMAIVLTLVTTTFKEFGLSAATWQAIFIVGAVLSGVWLVWSIREAQRSQKIEDIVAELKKDSRLKGISGQGAGT